MAKYRKKPVEIDAFQYFPQTRDRNAPPYNDLLHWLDEMGADTDNWRFAPDRIEIPTLEGTMTASIGDFIVRGIKGEFYPCKPDIFEATNELVR